MSHHIYTQRANQYVSGAGKTRIRVPAGRYQVGDIIHQEI